MIKLTFLCVIFSIAICCNLYRYGKSKMINICSEEPDACRDGVHVDGIMQPPTLVVISFFMESFIDRSSQLLVRNVDDIGGLQASVVLASIIFSLTEYLLLILSVYAVVDYFVIQPFFRVVRIMLLVSILLLFFVGALPLGSTLFLNFA